MMGSRINSGNIRSISDHKSGAELNLRARYTEYVIAIKELVPENLILILPADFVIKDSDILLMLGRTKDIRKIKGMK